ncbi:hypothetical protein [Streptomyces youssoufiensis]
MFEFESTKHPQLQVTSTAGKARFTDGRFATEDSALAEALADLPDWYGITLVAADEEPADDGEESVGDGDEPQGPPPPPRSAPKAAWAEHARATAETAEELDEIDDMTKEQLIDQYGGGE